MKTFKIKVISSIILLGLLAVGSLCSFTTVETRNIDESINTLEDIKEWMIDDVNNYYMDGERGMLYIQNLNQVIDRLYEERNQGK